MVCHFAADRCIRRRTLSEYRQAIGLTDDNASAQVGAIGQARTADIDIVDPGLDDPRAFLILARSPLTRCFSGQWIERGSAYQGYGVG